MTAAEKQEARRRIERKLDRSVLGSRIWSALMLELVAFDRAHPNIWRDDEEDES